MARRRSNSNPSPMPNYHAAIAYEQVNTMQSLARINAGVIDGLYRGLMQPAVARSITAASNAIMRAHTVANRVNNLLQQIPDSRAF